MGQFKLASKTAAWSWSPQNWWGDPVWSLGPTQDWILMFVVHVHVKLSASCRYYYFPPFCDGCHVWRPETELPGPFLWVLYSKLLILAASPEMQETTYQIVQQPGTDPVWLDIPAPDMQMPYVLTRAIRWQGIEGIEIPGRKGGKQQGVLEA